MPHFLNCLNPSTSGLWLFFFSPKFTFLPCESYALAPTLRPIGWIIIFSPSGQFLSQWTPTKRALDHLPQKSALDPNSSCSAPFFFFSQAGLNSTRWSTVHPHKSCAAPSLLPHRAPSASPLPFAYLCVCVCVCDFFYYFFFFFFATAVIARFLSVLFLNQYPSVRSGSISISIDTFLAFSRLVINRALCPSPRRLLFHFFILLSALFHLFFTLTLSRPHSLPHLSPRSRLGFALPSPLSLLPPPPFIKSLASPLLHQPWLPATEHPPP